MKVLHISRTMGQGGAEKIVYQLCVDNRQVEQFVASTGGIYVDGLRSHGIKHFRIPDINSKNPLIIIFCFFRILFIVRKYQIDIIHSHHRMAAFYSKIVSYFTKVSCVYTAHNVFFDKISLTRFSLSKSKVIAVGDGVKQNLVNVFKLNPKEIIVIYNSIKIIKSGKGNSLLNQLKSDNKILIGTIGRITSQKGIDIFIRAIARISKNYPNIMGIVVGDGEEKNRMKDLADSLGISQKIVFLGFQSNILDVMDQLDLVILSSRWEGLPLTPIEAFSQSKVVIATDISGNNEIITNNVNGILFKKDSVNELVRGITSVLRDPALRQLLESNAKQSYITKYQYKNFIYQYNNLYNSIIMK